MRAPRILAATRAAILAATSAAVLAIALPGDRAHSQTPPAQGSATPAPVAASDNSHGFTNATRFAQRDGGALYAAICAGCHMPDGRGAVGAGAYPALAGNEKLRNAAYPVQVVVNGLRGMPGFAGQLDDAQIAAVVNWTRAELGNNYRDEPARPEDVRSARP